MNTCEYCKFRVNGRCEHEDKLHESYYDHDPDGDNLTYDYMEGGGFSVGKNFGCIHWTEQTAKSKQPLRNCYEKKIIYNYR